MKKNPTSSGPEPLLKEFYRKMKLTILFLTISILSGFASESYSQTARLSLNLENSTIREVLKVIENQSEFRFFYSGEVDVDREISVTVDNKNIMQTLDQLFQGTAIRYEIYGRQIALLAQRETSLPAEMQQPAVLSGQVTDVSGAPLPGVTIAIKGTTTGTITDNNGKYSFTNVPQGAVLVFSFVGMHTQEIAVGNQTTINVTLQEESIGLEEIVAVGYGTQKKETLSGSVASISADEIASTKSENLISNIQGKVPGLLIRQLTGEPGKFNNYVSIRGFGAPLVIIDGIVRDGTEDLAQLNPNDIESMSVLKDAAAAIYGMNAANGVIIITTKKGLDGRAKFSYSNLLGIKGATGLEYTVDAYTYRVMKNEMDRNSQVAETYTGEILEKYRQGVEGYQDVDWIDLTLSDWVFQQNHNMSVRGGTKTVKYFASFGYNEDNGLLKSGIQYYNRYNLRASTTADLTKDLKMNVSFAGRIDERQSPREDFLWTFKTIMVNDRGINWHTLNNKDHFSVISPENKNAWALMHPDIDGYNRQRNTQFQSTMDLTLNVPGVPGLTVIATGAFDQNIRNSSFLQKSYNLYDYYTDNFSQTTGTDQYSNTIGLFQRAVARGQVNYTRKIDQHNLAMTGVAEFTGTRYDNIMAKRLYSDLFTNDIIDQGTSTTASNAGYRSFGRYAAYIGRINYDFAGKYLFEAVARYDGSYRYAKANRWAFFPSASAGWRLSEEPFIKDHIRAISNLKLRISYGESGTDAGNAFAYYSAYSASASNGYVFNDGSLTVGMVAPGVVHDRLTWVTAKISNLGVDLGLWDNKLGGSFELFERRQEGLLASLIQSVPNTFGASFPQENINSRLNHGFDVSVYHRGKIGKDFAYNVGANYTYSRTKELHVETAGYSSSWDNWRNNNNNRYVGRTGMYEWEGRFGAIEEYETAPLYGGTAGNSKMLPGSYKLIDLNGDGIISSNDYTYQHWNYGAINPPMQFGLTLDGSYKSFDLSLLFQGASGYSVNYRNNDIWGYGRYPTLHEKYLDRWHPATATDDPYNPATEWVGGFYPALRNYNYNNTQEAAIIDVWRPNATYLRLKSVELGYKLPAIFSSKIGMDNGRIFVNGYNLLTFCNKLLKDADPERQEADWDAGLNYPLMKSFNIGVNLNF